MLLAALGHWPWRTGDLSSKRLSVPERWRDSDVAWTRTYGCKECMKCEDIYIGGSFIWMVCIILYQLTTLSLKQRTFPSKSEGPVGWIDGQELLGFSRTLITFCVCSMAWWPELGELPWSCGASVVGTAEFRWKRCLCKPRLISAWATTFGNRNLNSGTCLLFPESPAMVWAFQIGNMYKAVV